MTTARSSGAGDAPRRPSGPSSRPPRSRTASASSSTSSSEGDAPHGAAPPRCGDPPGGEPVVEAGRVGRAHGLDGSFLVTRPLSGALTEGATVTIAGHARSIERRAGTAARPIIRVAGVADRAAAEALRREPLWVARTALPPLEEDEYWAEDLEGCAVVDRARPVGTVRAMLPLPSCEALDVARSDGGPEPLLVPLVRDAVRSVDIDAKRIDVDLSFLGED